MTRPTIAVADDPRPPPWRDARVAVVAIIVGLVAAAAMVTVAGLVNQGSPAAGQEPEVVAEGRCPESEFTCVTLRVPRDHFGSGGETLDVTFAVLRASGAERQGVFVTATGGPGTSGIASADSYTSVFDPSITERFDIVFFDQRGIGQSGPIQCYDAAVDYYATDAVPTVSEEAADEFAGVASDFSAACVAEAGVDASVLAFYATRQAVEDLDVFRRWLGADRIHLYGESYGTQYAQTYASVHPDRVAALLLDGPVDLTLEGTDYDAEAARAFDEALTHALETCTDACTEEAPEGGLLAAWDDLAADLESGPVSYELTLDDGTSEPRELSLGDLETASAGYVYTTTDQMLLQRAVAYAARGEIAPMGRLALISLGQDPDTLETLEDPTWSDALYYAVECMDYAYGSGDSESREAEFLEAGEEAGVAEHRLGSVFYGDLPCASWPVHAPTEERPPYITTDDFPILVLASTTDPATPYAGAQRIFEHAADGYLVTQPGGPHVIFGRGNACPDELVTAFLVDGERPARETECEPMTPDPYAPLPPASVSGESDPVTAMLGVDDEVNYSPDYWAWDGVEDLVVGCLHGGTLTYTATDEGYGVMLNGCAVSDGLPLSGKGLIDDAEGTFTLTATGPDGTDLAYERDAEYAVTLTGTWFGTDVNVEE